MMRRSFLYVLLTLFLGACSLMKNSKPEESASDLYQRGLDLQLQGEYSKALELYNQSLQKDSISSRTYSNRGLMREYLNDMEGAISDYLVAHRLEPEDPVCLNNIAALYCEDGQYDKAIIYFQKALAVDSLYALTCYNYGLYLFDTKNYRGAIKFLQRVSYLEGITIKKYKDERKIFALEDYYNSCKQSLYYIGLSYKYLHNTDSAKVYLRKAADRGVAEAGDSLKTLK